MKTYFLNIILFISILNFSPLNAQVIGEKVIAEGFDTVWELIWGPDDYIWVTERIGKISRVNPETGEVILIGEVSDVLEKAELGLMGMVLHPEFEETPHVFVVYTRIWEYEDKLYPNEAVVKRFTYDGEKLVDPVIIFDRIPIGGGTHAGARLFIDDDMTMYLTMGDARLGGGTGNGDLAQDLNSLNGKVLRMNLDGSAPDDNPFYEIAGINNYIWSYGHRNSQGFVKANGYFYASEHGPNTNDELNMIEKGRNYGWPNVNGFCTSSNEIVFCDENDVREPMAVYYDDRTLAISGMDYYENDRIPEWNNSLLIAALRQQLIVVAKLSEDGLEVIESTELFSDVFGRLREVMVSPDGRVFIGTSNWDAYGDKRNNSDKIIELWPNKNSVKKNDNMLKIYPNPSSGQIKISSDKTLMDYELYNQYGQLILEDMFLFSSNNRITGGLIEELNLNLNNGIYYIKLNSNFNSYVERIVISK